jgi:hypothetical protein
MAEASNFTGPLISVSSFLIYSYGMFLLILNWADLLRFKIRRPLAATVFISAIL